MFYRRKLLLSLLQEFEKPLSSIELQKLLFLVSLEQEGTPTYEFIPGEQGCYSFTIHTDQEILLRKGLLTCQEDKDFTIYSRLSLNQEAFTELDIKLKKEDKSILSSIEEAYKNYSTDELIKLTAELDPFYAMRSIWLNQFTFSKDFYAKQAMIKKEIESSVHALYTMGYEGISIEQFMTTLIRKNIKAVIDVRGNSNSMKRDFAKHKFAGYLDAVGIGYIPMPEIGVPNKIKREYLQSDRRQELFAWHEANVLEKKSEYIEKINTLAATQNVVLICFEKDPQQCHRSHVAQFCHHASPKIPIEHLGI